MPKIVSVAGAEQAEIKCKFSGQSTAKGKVDEMGRCLPRHHGVRVLEIQSVQEGMQPSCLSPDRFLRGQVGHWPAPLNGSLCS